MLRVLSLFSGVGGFDMGLEQAGMRTVFQCEIDPHCQQTLQHHWPDVPKWGDITTLTGRHILENCDGVDVVAWGSPCQDLSVAGKRAGLEGERSGLFHQGIRIIKELQEISHGQYPTWSIWENVAGALSSNAGSDFGQVLWEMDEAGACFSEWRILDAQYFGVPQRRRRVFVISRFHLGRPCDSGCEVSVIGESSGRDSSTGDTQKQNSAGEVVGCLRSGGAGGVPSSRGEHLVVEATSFGNTGFEKWSEQEVTVTLSARDYKSPNNIVGSLQARDYKGVGNQYVQENKLVVEDVVREI